MKSDCPRCHHGESTIRYDFGREKIVRCAACTLLYLDPWPEVEALQEVYGDSYFKNEEFLQGDNENLFGYADYIAERLNKQPQYAEIARELAALLPPRDRAPRLIEVGCGLGYFLSEAFEEGFEPAGLEFNASAVERLRRKYAFPIECGALEDIVLEPGAYDAVAMFDVIEHLRDPFTSLAKLRDALTPGGVIAISTADSESWVSRLFGSRLEDFRRTREHLYFFSRKTMTDVLEDAGFEVLEIRSIGHTFELSFLLDRLALYNRPVFNGLRRFVEAIGLGGVQLKINPLTKMIILARRRADAAIATDGTAAPAHLAHVDKVLIDELETLEHSTPSHYRWVADVIRPFLGRSILEVGSGTGVISKFLVPCCDSLILSDHDPAYLDRLRARFEDLPHVDFCILDLNDRPYPTPKTQPDTIVCLNVLEHIEDDDAVLRAFAELLPQGGRVILQVPNYPGLFGSLDQAYGHYRRYSPAGLAALFDRAGFDIVRTRRFNPASIPGWIVTNNVLRRDRLDTGSLRLYEKLLPLIRRLDFASRFAGLSLITCAQKR